MKKFINTILIAGIVLGVFALSGEAQDMDIQIKYSLFWLIELVNCGYGLNKFNTEKE